MKSLEAIVATSSLHKRVQIVVDEVTGLIEAVGDLGIPSEKVDYQFSDDCLLFAGMGDVHIHAREDVSKKHTYKEDFHSASCAALHGGVTHIGDMPNNPIPPIDDESYQTKLRLTSTALNTCWIYAGVGPKTRPLTQTIPYKVYMGPSVGELYFKNHQELDEVLTHYQGQWISFHCEDPEVLESHKEGADHFLRRPVEAEVLATHQALNFIKKYHLRGKLCHYSSGEGLQAIRDFRKNGGEVQVEVTPQHLFFSEEALRQKDFNFYQMNPPIRHEEDRREMLEAFKNGEIDYLATDHAPHTHEEKMKGTSGLTGLDTYGGFVTWLIVNQKISPKLIAKTCAENPGKFFNQFKSSWAHYDSRFSSFGKGLGFIEKGYTANLTILNLKKPWTVDADHLKTKVKHSPFLGIEFPGKVEKVMLKGQWI